MAALAAIISLGEQLRVQYDDDTVNTGWTSALNISDEPLRAIFTEQTRTARRPRLHRSRASENLRLDFVQAAGEVDPVRLHQLHGQSAVYDATTFERFATDRWRSNSDQTIFSSSAGANPCVEGAIRTEPWAALIECATCGQRIKEHMERFADGQKGTHLFCDAECRNLWRQKPAAWPLLC